MIIENLELEGVWRGLVVKQPWLELILVGKKIWEIRGSNTTIREKIALIQSGTGKIYGTANLVDCIKLTRKEFELARDRHCVPKEVSLPYKNIYAWVLEDAVCLDTPKEYKHPQGAVIWVALKENPDYINWSVVIVPNSGETITYRIKKDETNAFVLEIAYDSGIEWGTTGETLRDLFNGLKQDKSRGYCKSYKIIKNNKLKGY